MNVLSILQLDYLSSVETLIIFYNWTVIYIKAKSLKSTYLELKKMFSFKEYHIIKEVLHK